MTIIASTSLLIATILLAPPSPAGDQTGAQSVPLAVAKPVAKSRKPKSGKRRRDEAVSADGNDRDDHPKNALELARELGISSDDVRPENQYETSLFGKRLILGGKLNVEARGRRHYDLDNDPAGDDLTLAPEATLEAIWLPSATAVVFAGIKGIHESELYRGGGGAGSKSAIKLDSLWFLKTRLFQTPLAIQVGRQKMQDRRGWWWDENLDAVRLHYFGSKLTAFVGIGMVSAVNLSTRTRPDPEEKGLLRSFGAAEWEWTRRNTISLFALHQDDRTSRYSLGSLVDHERRDGQDAALTWIGARARGCVKPKLPRRICYWGEIAQVRGSELAYRFSRASPDRDEVDRVTRRKVSGWGFDTGVSIELPIKSKPYLTLGYARGSADRPGTPGRDGAFRQTGLHDNDGKFRGLTRFHYYGEVLRPNLSNIAISTVALGVPVGRHNWIETVWHDYRQPVADNDISGSRLDRDPAGRNGRLGHELDVIFSHRGSSGWVFELTGGAFRAGPAFGSRSGRVAGMAEIKIDYNF